MGNVQDSMNKQPQRPHQHPQHEMNRLEMQKKIKEKAYEHINKAIDLEKAGNYNEAVHYYLDGAEELKKALRIQFSPMEWENAKALHFTMKNNLNKVEERVATLTKKRSDSAPTPSSTTQRLTSSNRTQTISSSNLRNSGNRPLANSKPLQRSGVSSQPTTKNNNNASLNPSKPSSALQGVDPKLANLILNELVEKTEGLSLNDVVGLEKAKQALMESVILPIVRPDIFTGLRSPIKGLLLFGPPGNGKTFIAKAIASEANAKFFSLSASSLVSKWHGESEKMVRALFAVARYVAPSVIFIDEIDAILSERSSQEHEASRRLKTEFLVQVDGVSTSSTERILLMGATNRPQDLDEAARRRLVKRIYVPLPDKESREKLIISLLSKSSTPCKLKKYEIEQIVKLTEGYSSADLTSLCKDAALEPIRELGMNIKDLPANQVRPIVFQDFEKAAKNIRPSVSKQSIKMYEKWNKEYGHI